MTSTTRIVRRHSQVNMMNRTAIFAFCLLTLFVASADSHAATIVGGSELLSESNADQLQSWLNEGPLTLTRIFAKGCGDDSFDFHAAVNGKGATFTVIEIENEGYISRQIIGGYNPLSWSSDYSYNVSDSDERNAFLFNLSYPAVQTQKLDLFGAWQTFNAGLFGPVFGGGDIVVMHNLADAWIRHFSYGPTTLNDNILEGTTSEKWVNIGKLEVFSVAPSVAPVLNVSSAPEPASLAIWGLGALGCVGAGAWRKRKAARS